MYIYTTYTGLSEIRILRLGIRVTYGTSEKKNIFRNEETRLHKFNLNLDDTYETNH